MAVYTIGALPAARTLNKRRLPAAAAKSSAAFRVATRPRPALTSSNTGLPGALAPPPPRTLNKRKVSSVVASAPVLNKRRAPSAPAPAPSGGGAAIASGDYEYYDGGGGGETYVPGESYTPAPSGGGGMIQPASDVEIVPPGGESAPKDGIPAWAAFAGIAACVVVGALVLHQRGIL